MNEWEKKAESIWAILNETAQKHAEYKAEADKRQAEADKETKQLKKQIGEIGNKFGLYTEGLSSASIERMFYKKFGVEETYFRTKKRDKTTGANIEMDAWGVANGDKNMVVIAEVKNGIDNDALEQMQRIIADFRLFYPEHAQKSVYGVLVGVNIPQHIRQKAEKLGFYLATVSDTMFTMCNDKGFKGTAY